jgi:hypothetical protein
MVTGANLIDARIALEHMVTDADVKTTGNLIKLGRG